MPRSIHMGFKRDPLFRQFAKGRQRHHLKPTTVRQNGAVPVHEFMQATQAINPFRRGAQHQVIGIAQ